MIAQTQKTNIMQTSYHTNVELPLKAILITRNVLSQEINDIITEKLIAYGSPLYSIYIFSNNYYIFLYLEIHNQLNFTHFDRIDITL